MFMMRVHRFVGPPTRSSGNMHRSENPSIHSLGRHALTWLGMFIIQYRWFCCSFQQRKRTRATNVYFRDVALGAFENLGGAGLCLKRVWPMAVPPRPKGPPFRAGRGAAAPRADRVSRSLETCPLLFVVGRRGMLGYNREFASQKTWEGFSKSLGRLLG